MNVFAHRGYSGRYPQNTMLAFREAEKTGCDGIELDVQMTKDGQLVIIHDEAIDGLTDGTGYVRDYTYEELFRFRVTDNQQEAYGVQRIPTFEEYCVWVKDTGLISNVEIKSSVFYYENIEEKTVETIKKYGLSDRMLISSFNHLSIIRSRELAPEIRVGALLGHEGIGNPGYYCSKSGFDCYHPGIGGLTREAVLDCQEHGIAVNVWTVNDMGNLVRVYDWGCDTVITNYPDVCKCFLNAMTQKG